MKYGTVLKGLVFWIAVGALQAQGARPDEVYFIVKNTDSGHVFGYATVFL